MCTMKREEKDQWDMTTVIFACIFVREGGGGGVLISGSVYSLVLRSSRRELKR